ncbi:XRE family transcriptional regulator [Bacillus sp. F19]|nr:XRE family transcriptional regulator [Bacillus sp. F19]
MPYKFFLKEVLEEIDQSRNSIAVEAKVRPASLYDIYHGKMKRIELESFGRILDTINMFAEKKGIDKRYTIESIVRYEYEGEGVN